jgi:nitrate/nitrite transporter NarK
MRNVLPVLVSGLLGSMGTMGAMLLLTGNPLTLMTTSNNSTLMMLIVLFVLSFTWQYNQIKSKKKNANQDPNMPQMQQVDGQQIQTRQRRAGDLPDLRDFS